MTCARQGERGHVLLASLILALVLGLTCGAMMIVSVTNSTSGQNNVHRTQALSLAEIAIERAKAQLAAGTYDPQFDAHAHVALDAGSVDTAAGGLYGDFLLRVTEDFGDVEDQFQVISMGTVGEQVRQIEVVIRRGPAEIPNLLGAINLYNPNGLANFSGSPPRVCGLDTDLPEGVDFASAKDSDCIPGSGDGPDACGVAVHDDQSVTDIIAELGHRPERITGTDGSGGEEEASVYNVTSPNPTGQIDTQTADDIATFAEQCMGSADYIYDGGTWYSGSGQLDANGNFGSVSDPKVVVIQSGSGGTIHLNGTIAGAGLLIIDCDVQFGGTFNYAGLILITNRGNATVSVDMRGTPLVLGSIVAANPGVEATSVLDLRGTADVFYSRQGLQMAETALAQSARFVTKYYAEKKPDEDLFELDQ